MNQTQIQTSKSVGSTFELYQQLIPNKITMKRIGYPQILPIKANPLPKSVDEILRDHLGSYTRFTPNLKGTTIKDLAERWFAQHLGDRRPVKIGILFMESRFNWVYMAYTDWESKNYLYIIW